MKNDKTMSEFTFKQDFDRDGVMVWENAKTIERYKELNDTRSRADVSTEDIVKDER